MSNDKPEQHPTKSLVGLRQWWIEAVAKEECLYQSIQVYVSDHPQNDQHRADAVQYWWLCVRRMLLGYRFARVKFGETLEPFPHGLFDKLSGFADELSRGRVPNIVNDVRRRGVRSTARERQDIAWAIFYIEAAEAGEILDRSPKKTVRIAYNVDPQTVRNWLNERDLHCRDFTAENVSSGQIKNRMEFCAETFSALGRKAHLNR